MRPFALAAIVAALAVVGTANTASAHIPNIASFNLIPGDEAWRLEVHMSTDGMHQALQAIHPGESLSELDPDAYRGLVLDALLAGIQLRFDDDPVSLEDGTVNVQAHSSSARFSISPPPAGTLRVEAHIDALSQRGDQNNIFRLISPGAGSRVVLKTDNRFRGSLGLSPASSEAPDSASSAAADATFPAETPSTSALFFSSPAPLPLFALGLSAVVLLGARAGGWRTTRSVQE